MSEPRYYWSLKGLNGWGIYIAIALIVLVVLWILF